VSAEGVAAGAVLDAVARVRMVSPMRPATTVGSKNSSTASAGTPLTIAQRVSAQVYQCILPLHSDRLTYSLRRHDVTERGLSSLVKSHNRSRHPDVRGEADGRGFASTALITHESAA